MAAPLGVGARGPAPLRCWSNLAESGRPLSSAGRPPAELSYPLHCSHRRVWHHERLAIFSLASGRTVPPHGRGWSPTQERTERSRRPQGRQAE